MVSGVVGPDSLAYAGLFFLMGTTGRFGLSRGVPFFVDQCLCGFDGIGRKPFDD